MTDGIQFDAWQKRALVIGAIAAVVSIAGLFINRAQFFHSYLFAWLFWTGLSLGALVLVMMQFLTGGQWGLAVRSLAVAAFPNASAHGRPVRPSAPGSASDLLVVERPSRGSRRL